MYSDNLPFYMQVFVMGDNRNHSLDSRKLGYFDFDNDVIGKVFFKIPL